MNNEEKILMVLEKMQSNMDRMQSNMDRMKSDINEMRTEMNERLDTMDGRLSRVEDRLDTMDGRLIRVEDQLAITAQDASWSRIAIEGHVTQRLNALTEFCEGIQERMATQEELDLFREEWKTAQVALAVTARTGHIPD